MTISFLGLLVCEFDLFVDYVPGEAIDRRVYPVMLFTSTMNPARLLAFSA
jgi:hypothetical protein